MGYGHTAHEGNQASGTIISPQATASLPALGWGRDSPRPQILLSLYNKIHYQSLNLADDVIQVLKLLK